MFSALSALMQSELLFLGNVVAHRGMGLPVSVKVSNSVGSLQTRTQAKLIQLFIHS